MAPVVIASETSRRLREISDIYRDPRVGYAGFVPLKFIGVQKGINVAPGSFNQITSAVGGLGNLAVSAHRDGKQEFFATLEEKDSGLWVVTRGDIHRERQTAIALKEHQAVLLIEDLEMGLASVRESVLENFPLQPAATPGVPVAQG